MLCRPACGDPKPGNWDLTGGVELFNSWFNVENDRLNYILLSHA